MAFTLAALRRRHSTGAKVALDREASLAVEQSPDVLLSFDGALDCIFAPATTPRLFGRPAAEIIGGSLRTLGGDDQAVFDAAVTRARSGQVGAEAVFRTARPTGEQCWIEARFGAADAQGKIVAAFRDVSTRKTAELALRVANLELNKLAGSDGLTELANRRRFDQTLESECRRAARNSKPVSLLLIDVDRFKIFNDLYGHQAGDACLKEIAGVLRTCATRTADTAARFGGEEFAMVLPDTDGLKAAAMAEQVRHAVGALNLPHTGNPESGSIVTVSIGCATVEPTPDTLGAVGGVLIAEADRALYDAKRLGRNRIVAPALKAEDEVAAERRAADLARMARFDAFRRAGALEPSSNLDRIARMAAVLLGMPSAFVVLLDRDKVMVVGHYGFGAESLDLPRTFYAHLMGARSAVVVPDVAADARFCTAAAAQNFAFLAAAPLLSGDDLQHVGALWVADRQARPGLDEPKRLLLSRLAGLVMDDLEARRADAPSARAA